MTYEIRPCRMEDAQALGILCSEELGYPVTTPEITRAMERILSSDRDRIFAAVSGERIVGYLHIGSHDVLSLPPMKSIHGLAVAGDCQRQGIGRALIRAAEDWAREDGAVGIRLVSGSSRPAAHAFYRSCGYESKKTQLNFKKYF